MDKLIVKVLKGSSSLPKYETEGSAGMDIRALLDEDMIVKRGEIGVVPTGLKVAIPVGYEMQIRARSGLAIKKGISLINGIGTIDSDYRGEIMVGLINHGKEDFKISNGDRIAQMVLKKYERFDWEEVEELDETDRGEGGFGHTGSK